ncbi:hypothetical protein Q8F55_004710 [Vanrija albida]
MRLVTSLALAASLAALASAAVTPSRTTKFWGQSPAKRQVQPSNLPNNCIYTCSQFSQELNGMCAITTSRCESVQAASGGTSTDVGCSTWSTNCNQLAAQFEASCTQSTNNCVDCGTASTDANNLCTQTAQACLNDPAVQGGTQDLTTQCYVAKAVCDWELSLLAQVTTCGTADCAAPCYAFVAFPAIAGYLDELCSAAIPRGNNCFNAYSTVFNQASALGTSCSIATGFTPCFSVGIYTRPCSYFTSNLQTIMASGVTTCQNGLTAGTAAYNSCASVWDYNSAFIQEYISSIGC